MMKRLTAFAFLAIVTPALARAADEPPAKLPLDVLLDTPISTAAKYDQQLSKVAASATVITAEEIERYGWTSLAEVLGAVRGFYVTYDRWGNYIGVRGIGRPTDYNTRLLILMDGQPVAAPVFGDAEAGDLLAIDLGTVEKIEIIRGPGSALYGAHAMLAVINIISKNADAIAGTSFAAVAGSQGKKGAALRAGREFANGLQITASGYWQEASGANLHFPEYDAPETNHGVAEGLDYENFDRFTLVLRKGGLRFALSTRRSTKGIPTAMWDTNFNTDEAITTGRDVATINYQRALGPNKTIEVRGYWDRARSRGHYQYDDLGIDRYTAETAGGEARLQWDLSPNHRLTAGAEYANNRRLHYWYEVGDYRIDLDRPGDVTSYYLQYEGHPSAKWGFVAGVRRDDFFLTADSTNPRAALLFTPNASTSLKLLYGSAFQSPTAYQAFYSDPLTPWKAHPDLKAETIRTTELVWEQRLSPVTLMVASAFHINADDLIDEQLEPVEQVNWFNNVETLKSDGLELGIHSRRENGVWTSFSGSLQRALSDGERATNAPLCQLKARVSTSPWAPWHAGIEGLFETSRRTRDGDYTGSSLLVNGIVSRQIGEHFRLALSSRNLLNTAYYHPAGHELRGQSLRQDGRTFTLKLTYSR